MWILTIPSFTWIEVDLKGQSEPPPRAHPARSPSSHTSNLVSGIEIPIVPAAGAAAKFQSAYGTLGMVGADGEVRPLEEMEADVIHFAISHYRGQMSEVARRLKIGRSTLYRKLEEADGGTPKSGSAGVDS